MRGPCEYKRPIGWTRHAFKVIDRFGDNVWLGLGGKRRDICDPVPGEWAGV